VIDYSYTTWFVVGMILGMAAGEVAARIFIWWLRRKK